MHLQLRSAIVLLAFFALSACVQALGGRHVQLLNPADGVYQGEPVFPQDQVSRFMVSLRDQARARACSGSLISKRHILTAAHCFSLKTLPADVRVQFGLKTDPSGYLRSHSIRKITFHPKFIPLLEDHDPLEPAYDLAIVELSEPAPEGVQILILEEPNYSVPSSGTAGYGEGEALVIGYGLTKAKAYDSGILRQKRVPLAYIESRDQGHLLQLHSMAGGPCFGDSGGPLVRLFPSKTGASSFRLLGVASQVFEISSLTPSCQGLAVYSGIPAFRAWIDQEIQSLQ